MIPRFKLRQVFRAIILTILLALGQWVHAGLKIDTIYFQDGDRITGEVRSLKNNQLLLETDDGGDIEIEWSKVDQVKILNTMRIVMDDGKIIYGLIHLGDEEGTGNIRPIGEAPMWVYLVRVVAMTPVEERFLDRLSGLFSSGFSYAKATEIMQFTMSASLNYEAEINHVELFYDGNTSKDPAAGFSQRQLGGLTYKHYLPKKWFIISQLTLENNTELGLDLRTAIEGGLGNSIIYSNAMRLDLGGGLLLSQEKSIDLSAYNIETILIGDYSVYISEAPDINFTFRVSLIPSLSNIGRIRTEISSNLRWEIISDLSLKWSFYHSFDSQPLAVDAARTDWALTMLGLEYHIK